MYKGNALLSSNNFLKSKNELSIAIDSSVAK